MQVQVLSALQVPSHNAGWIGQNDKQCRKVVPVARKIVDEPSEDVVANAKRDRAEKRSLFARLALFIRQVIAELKKVVTPTRKELGNYVVVVLIFVVIMMALVSFLDWVFALAVTYVFGTPAA